VLEYHGERYLQRGMTVVEQAVYREQERIIAPFM
jgi:hypothetical protein